MFPVFMMSAAVVGTKAQLLENEKKILEAQENNKYHKHHCKDMLEVDMSMNSSIIAKIITSS